MSRSDIDAIHKPVIRMNDLTKKQDRVEREVEKNRNGVLDENVHDSERTIGNMIEGRWTRAVDEDDVKKHDSSDNDGNDEVK